MELLIKKKKSDFTDGGGLVLNRMIYAFTHATNEAEFFFIILDEGKVALIRSQIFLEAHT